MELRPEILHRWLLQFELPGTSEEDRTRCAIEACRQARKLLEEHYHLFADFPVGAAGTRPAGEDPLPIGVLVRGFYGQLETDQGKAENRTKGQSWKQQRSTSRA